MCVPALLPAAGLTAAGTGAATAVGFAGAGAMTGGAFFSGASAIGAAGAATGAAAGGISLSSLSLVGQIAKGLYGFAQSRAQAQAAQSEADYRAAVQRENAKRANYLATDALERGKEEERMERLRGRLLVGQMRAVMGGSGVDVNEGSAADLTFDQAEVNELNSRIVRNNSAREAQEFRIQASQFESDSNLTQIAGNTQASNIRAGGFRSLIGSATTVAGKWFQYKEAGVFG